MLAKALGYVAGFKYLDSTTMNYFHFMISYQG